MRDMKLMDFEQMSSSYQAGASHIISEVARFSTMIKEGQNVDEAARVALEGAAEYLSCFSIQNFQGPEDSESGA